MKIFYVFFTCIFATCNVFCIKSLTQNSRPNQISNESFDDFKTLMMYFNEPLLSSAALDDVYIGDKKGASFEGAYSSVMSSKLSETIEKISAADVSEIKKFGQYLADGNNFTKSLPKDFSELILEDYQSELIEILRIKEKIVFPFGWIGSGAHAIGLVIELNENGTYNLIVINTGDGLQYHAKIADPNGVYHSFPRMWIEFKNIPKEEIFPQNAWFMYVFLAFNDENLVKDIESVVKSVPHYFYGSILSNFIKYVQEPDLSHNKLLPAQRSGSCTLSSLMASYFYLEKDDVNFHKSRVIIGHQMLEDFIKKYKNSHDFKTLITDGFDTVARNLWYSTSSALAHQLLSYLEYRFPKSFKNAGLIGAERNSWIESRKEIAVNDLNESKDDVKLVEKTIELARKIHEILKKNEINSDTRIIQTKSIASKLNAAEYKFDDFTPWENSRGQIDLNSIFSNTIERESIIIDSYVSLRDKLNYCTSNSNVKIFSCIRDTFESVDKDNWWVYLDNIDEKESLNFLKLCTKIIKIIISSMYLPNTLDDIVTLAHLQIGIWKSAVEYDKTLSDENLYLGLENFSPPPILEDLINNFKPSMTSGKYENWPIITTFAPNNIDKLKYLLESYTEITNGDESFLGPSMILTSFKTNDCDTSEMYRAIESTKNSLNMYKKIFVNTKIQGRIENERNIQLRSNNDWNRDYAKLTIIFKSFDDVSLEYPHFVDLINGMIWIYKRAANIPFSLKYNNNTFQEYVSGPDKISLNYLEQDQYAKKYLVNMSYHDNLRPIESFVTLKQSRYFGTFFKLRHSQARGDPENIINFESWLNYVKGSNDSKIFDEPYFMYLSNHIMNMPRLTLANDGKVQDEKKELYPEGFEEKHVKEIFENFMRLIKVDLNLLILKKGQLSKETTKKLLNRAINMAIPLVRFIVRIDYDKIVDADSCSEMFSIVYKSFFKFGSFKNEFNLDEEQISTVNLVLTQICDAPIRNPEIFLNRINDLLPQDKIIKFRKSLARVHWFICKSYYVPDSPGKSHADDLFTNGFMFYKVAFDETENIKTLIDLLIVPWHIDNPDKITYIFSKDGNIIIIKIENQDLLNSTTLCIQLSSGLSIKNGYQVVDKSIILNNNNFKDFFSTDEDKKDASRGEITKIGTIIMYIVNDFKYRENTIALLCESDNCKVYRKYEKNWYEWINNETEIENFEKATNYFWTIGFKFYKRNVRPSKTLSVNEMIVVKDEDSAPLFSIKVLSSRTYNNLLFTAGKHKTSWKLLNLGSEKDDNELEKHLRKFTDTDTILARKISEMSLVIIYPGLRFKDDPNHPVILVETEPSSNIFEVLNVPGLKIETDQNAVNNIGISGTLVAQSKDGQRFILAPISPTESNPESINRVVLRYIEKIPIVKVKKEINPSEPNPENINRTVFREVPAPQTRLQRLVLAFYCIKAREFNFARELLHPFTSINQNEVFDKSEIEIIKWITSINGTGPEAEALKLMAAYHAILNSVKFPLSYLKDNLNLDTTEAKEKKLRSSALFNIKECIIKTANIYFGSIRELPEKYYLHRILPEFFDPKIIENFKIIDPSDSQPTIFEDNYNRFAMPFYVDNSNLKVTNFGKVEATEIGKILRMISSNRNNYFFKKYLNRYSKIVHLTKNEGRLSTYSDSEIIILCLSFDQELYSEAANLFEAYENYFNLARNGIYAKRTVTFNSISKEINDATDKCKREHGDKLKRRLNVSERSTFTDFDMIINTLKADMKIEFKARNQFKFYNFEPVKEEEKDKFCKLSQELKVILRPTNETIDASFLVSNLNISPILRKLEESINAFVKEKEQFSVSELILSESARNIINDFKYYLKVRSLSLNANMNNLSSELTTLILANDSNTNNSKSIESLNRLMHQRKVKMFPKLYSCYQKESVECIQNKFPQLNGDECVLVLNSTMEFYSYQVLLNYYNMLLESVKSLLELPKVSVDGLLLFLDELEKINDFNDRIKTPSILNFEYRSKKYRLRSEQVRDIENLTAKDEKTGLYKSSVIQRMMAAGKTLVLGTISVVQKALDSSKLSILVPPSSLYQSNLSAMQSRTYSFFKTKGHSFTFPRFQFGSNQDIIFIVIPFLESILRNIAGIKKANDYYVLSPDSLQAFMNSYIEMINYQVEKCNFNENNCNDIVAAQALSLYAKIYDIFRTQGSIILDEIDMTMNPNKELNFPTTENEPFNMIAATLSTDLIEHSINDDYIVKTIGLDIFGNNQSALTDNQYAAYRKALFDYIEVQLNVPDSLWSELLLAAEFPELQKDKIMELLRSQNMEHMKDWVQTLYKADKIFIANALVIIKAQIWRNFKYAFKAANTPSPSSEFADRWETLNKTLLTFASVNCTERIAEKMITYIKKSIIEEMSLEIKLEDTAMYKNVTTFIPGVNVMKLDGNDALDIGLIHGALKTRSPIAIRLLFSYALDEIFSEMKFPAEQITSNALNMASMFGSVQGYSGTIDNVNILPREVVTGAYGNHLINEKNNGGIVLKLIKDSKKSKGEAGNVYQISEDDIKKPAKEMIQIMINGLQSEEQKCLSAIIDTGAFFKNFKNRQISEAILDILRDRIDVVLYYDEDSNQVEFIKRTGNEGNAETGFISSTDPESIFKATQTDISTRFTFYDQRHITGSDILQPKTAIALMTVGTRVLLRDILQGTLRMRQFMTSQKVYLVTSTSAAKFYHSKAFPDTNDDNLVSEVTVTDIVSLGAFNEDEKQLEENEKLAFVKIDNEVRRFVLEEITSVILLANDTNNLDLLNILPIWFDIKKDGSKSIRDLFIRLIKENPIGWMVKIQKKESSLVLKEYANFWIKKLLETAEPIDDISNDFSLKSSRRFDELKRVLTVMTEPGLESNSKESLLEFLEPEITEHICENNAGGEVELQVFTQQLAELDLENLLQRVYGYSDNFHRKTLKLNILSQPSPDADINDSLDCNYISLNSILFDDSFAEEHKQMSRAALITNGKKIGVSYDLINFVDFVPLRPYKIFSMYTWEGSHILVQVKPGNKGVRALLLSVESANDVRNEMMKTNFDSQESNYWLCDLSGSISQTNDINSTNLMNIFDLIPDSRELFFDLLVFNGSFDHLTVVPQMREILFNKWLKADNLQYRAMFLLMRMKVLADKSDHIFSDDSYYMTILKRAARGDKNITSELKNSSGSYKKPPVSSEIEIKFYEERGMERLSINSLSEKNVVDFHNTYTEITNLLSENACLVKIGTVYPLEDTKIGDDLDPINEMNDLTSNPEIYPNDVNVVIELTETPSINNVTDDLSNIEDSGDTGVNVSIIEDNAAESTIINVATDELSNIEDSSNTGVNASIIEDGTDNAAESTIINNVTDEISNIEDSGDTGMNASIIKNGTDNAAESTTINNATDNVSNILAAANIGVNVCNSTDDKVISPYSPKTKKQGAKVKKSKRGKDHKSYSPKCSNDNAKAPIIDNNNIQDRYLDQDQDQSSISKTTFVVIIIVLIGLISISAFILNREIICA